MPKYQEVSSKSSRDRSRGRRSYRYSQNSDENEKIKEWEKVRCLICLDYPHNAFLLICSSHDNGCRPYMCNSTTSLLSTCLSQFRDSEGRLSCPLCRGQIMGEKAVDDTARRYMNSKSRACAVEYCSFTGTHTELVEHASNDHSSMRPSEVDMRRQRDWTMLEYQRELQDVHSALGHLVSDTDLESEFVTRMTRERVDGEDQGGQPRPRRTVRMRAGHFPVARPLASRSQMERQRELQDVPSASGHLVSDTNLEVGSVTRMTRERVGRDDQGGQPHPRRTVRMRVGYFPVGPLASRGPIGC